MAWERVYFIYSVYTAVWTLLLIVGLGKFFCVRRIYDLYDDIDKFFDDGLHIIITVFTIFGSFSMLSLWMRWEVVITICCVAMVLISFVSLVIILVGCLVRLFKVLRKMHYNIKFKKNM